MGKSRNISQVLNDQGLIEAADLAPGVGTPEQGFNFRNRIINGDMKIDQRNAGASVTPTSNTYTIDRWFAGLSQSSKFSVQRSTTAPTGFVNSAIITSTSAYSITSTDRFAFSQFIEGLNCTDLGWGTASAKTMTLSFQVRSSLTGTFGGAFQNNASDRSYPFTYTISAANTWETKTVTVAGDTTGTWLTDTGIGIQVRFSLGTGSTYSNTAGAWVAGDYRSATGATSVVGTNGATLYITGVQLEVGSVATPFERRPYGTELALCQRYFQKIGGDQDFHALAMANLTQTDLSTVLIFPQQMRAAPSGTVVGTPRNLSGGVVATNQWSVYFSGAWKGCTSVSLSSFGVTACRMDASPYDSVTSGGASGFYGGASCYFSFSAEL